MARRKQLEIPALFSLPSVVAPQRLPVQATSEPARPGTADLDRPGQDLLASWAVGRARRVTEAAIGGLRFAFYWRVSTEDHQDPVTSRAWQLGQALATIADAGRITVEFSDVGKSRTVAPQRRPGMAALLAALENPNRGFDAVVIGSNERAFCGNQLQPGRPAAGITRGAAVDARARRQGRPVDRHRRGADGPAGNPVPAGIHARQGPGHQRDDRAGPRPGPL